MTLRDRHPDTLAAIAGYATHAIDGIALLQAQMRENAKRLGFDGGYLRLAADMMDDVIHDELAPALVRTLPGQSFGHTRGSPATLPPDSSATAWRAIASAISQISVLATTTAYACRLIRSA